MAPTSNPPAKGKSEADDSFRLLRYGVTASAGYGYFFFVDCQVGRALIGLSIVPSSVLAMQLGIAAMETIDGSTYTLFVGASGNADLLTRAFGY